MQPDLHFDRLPAIFPRYLRALFNGRPADRVGDGDLPESRATVDAVTADRRQLERFRELLAHPDDGRLPPTFPQVMAAPLHLSLLTSPLFPLRATGLVHVENSITVYDQLDDRQPLQLVARLGGRAEAGRDIEIDLSTAALASGSVVWNATSLLLARRRGARQRPSRSQRASMEPSREIDRWTAARDIGRRYALVSGDFNPIHLFSLTARPFGFSSAIAHGMWSLGRAIAGLYPLLTPPFRIAAGFRRPMLLPADLRLLLDQSDRFRVEDAKAGKAYLAGSIGGPADTA